MATQTVTQCETRIKALLRDTAGDVYTSAVLLPFIQQTVDELFAAYRKVGNPRVIRVSYPLLPADTSALKPVTAGIADMGEPISVGWRENVTTYTVSGCTTASPPVVTTSAAHGRATGDIMTLNRIGGMPETSGMWAITVTAADKFTPNGCVGVGTFSAGGGDVAVYSAELFQPFDARRFVDQMSGSEREYAWREDHFWFVPSPRQRQLQIRYYSSATVPTAGGDVIDVDDAINFIALRAAALACSTAAPTISDRMNLQACGRTGIPDGTGGALHGILQEGARSMQRLRSDERSRIGYTDRDLYRINQ